jgi:dihydropteroate synthase
MKRPALKNKVLTVNNRTFTWGSRTYLMGILNITPDSFSGDGLMMERQDQAGSSGIWLVEAALEQARRFILAGVDFLDIGGESTRPGSQPVSAVAELERVIPVVQALAKEFDGVISIDTYKAEVAEPALAAGAHVINDVWGLRADPDLAQVAARYGAPVILMHNRSSWVHAEVREKLGGRYVNVPYDNLLEDIKRELLDSIEIASEAGIKEEQIILDPGIGFGKTVEQNLQLLNRVDEVCALGYPVLIGPSRKSFIGYVLDLPPEQRIEGTAAAVTIGIVRGADIIRVHDIEYMARVARMTDAVLNSG